MGQGDLECLCKAGTDQLVKADKFFMNTKLCILILILLSWGKGIHAQISLKCYGATVKIPKGSAVHCEGNVELRDKADVHAQLVLDGELSLKGNLISRSFAKVRTNFPDQGGSIRFSSVSHRQYIIGTDLIRLPRLILENPWGLELKQELELTQNLTFLRGKIYTGAFSLRMSRKDSLAISNYSQDNYIVGTLSQYLRQGKTSFPIGSEHHLQMLEIELDQNPSLRMVDASFSSEEVPLHDEVDIDGGRIVELLDNGVWTLSSADPAPLNFELILIAQGHSNEGREAGMHTFLVNKGLGWESEGQFGSTHGSANVRLSTSRHNMNSWGDFVIGKAAYILSRPTPSALSSFNVSNNGSSMRKIGVNFYSETSGEYSLELRDLSGRLLLEWEGFALAGTHTKQLDLQAFSQGLYVLILQKNGERIERKIW